MAAADNIVLVDATSGARTITLPSPTNGRVVFIKDSKGQAASHNITIDPFAAETIDGAASLVINQNYGSVHLGSDGTNWFILSEADIGAYGITQLTGDVTAGPGSGSQAATLATVNSNVGTFASVTVNGKGLVTAAAELSGDATTSGADLTLATVNANVGSFGSSTSIPNFTVNGKGLITAAGGNVVIAPAGTLSGTTLNSTVVSSSLTSVGTLASLTVSGSSTLGTAAASQVTIGASGASVNQIINGGLQLTTNTVSANYSIV